VALPKVQTTVTQEETAETAATTAGNDAETKSPVKPQVRERIACECGAKITNFERAIRDHKNSSRHNDAMAALTKDKSSEDVQDMDIDTPLQHLSTKVTKQTPIPLKRAPLPVIVCECGGKIGPDNPRLFQQHAKGKTHRKYLLSYLLHTVGNGEDS
jgi:hypothetical protein